MSEQAYTPELEDVGNIVGLEHVNLTVPDQSTATAFYVGALGGTRDPYLMVGLDNMWVNLGDQQFHLPTNNSQQLRGHVGLVVPSLGPAKGAAIGGGGAAGGNSICLGGQALLRRGHGPLGK